MHNCSHRLLSLEYPESLSENPKSLSENPLKTLYNIYNFPPAIIVHCVSIKLVLAII